MEDTLVRASEKPKVRELISAFQKCTPWGDGSWNRVTDNENVRFTRWPNQWPDGKKHDTSNAEAFPFDGASDTRIPLADSVINENVAVCCAAFWRAMIKPKGGQSEASNYAVKLLDFFINEVMFEELVREVELSAQYREMLGWVVLHPTWRREICMGRRCVKIEELVQLANATMQQEQQQQAQAQAQGQGQPVAPSEPNPLAMLPAMVMDASQDKATAGLMQQLYDDYARQQIEEQVEVEVPPLKPATLMRAIRELRETGETYLPIPYVSKNEPLIVSLKPWDEIFVPNGCTDIQMGPVIFRRVWMTEEQLREKILTEGWDPQWVEEAIKHKGKYSTWANTGAMPTTPPTAITDAMAGTTGTNFQPNAIPNETLVEVIYATARQLDDDNIPGIYLTVFNVNVCEVPGKPGTALCAEHTLIDHEGEFPYVAGQRENWNRNITSARGVPQIASTWQREIKVQRDGLVDHTSLGVTPPLMMPKGAMATRFKFGPARQNEVTPGREPKFLEVPNSGTPLALELHQVIGADVDNYFGRMAPEVPPARVQTKQTMLVQPFLMMWTKAFTHLMRLAQRYMPDATFVEITGAPPGWLDQRREVRGVLAAKLHFDSRELDPDFVMKQLEALNTVVVPGDVAGVIDRAKLTKLQLRAINPALANELVADEEAASQRLFNQVQNDLALMFIGNEAQYVQMDPTAGTKLQMAQQIIQNNPNYQQALQERGRFAALFDKWTKNLQFSVAEQQNKQIGAIGVKPMGATGVGGAQ